MFDTEAGVLTGEGDINLATEQVNFLLVPEPRYPSLMNFWTKLRVSGPIMDPKVRPDTLSLLTKGAKALSALVIGPLGLLAPFVNLGAYKAHPCNVHRHWKIDSAVWPSLRQIPDLIREESSKFFASIYVFTNISIVAREKINEIKTMSFCTFFVCYAIKR